MKIFSFIIILFVALNSLAQKNFDSYTTIQAEGKIPNDFTILSSSKVKTGMEEQNTTLSSRERKVFLEGIHYGIDELLQSGLVIYGDEISKYINDVADKLLAKEKKLRDQLRFYTIKSNATNAFSTDQGIIFVTTGLVSQLVNEAQLAFILAHEIAHFTEKHVIETFEYKSRNKGINYQITQLATYSKDKEFEADILGIEFYQKAGYTKKDILRVFDVMMYSYLPIDEVPIGRSYFQSELCYLPSNLFPTDKFEIKAAEDYDDSRSSHPNIKSRKEKALLKIESLKDWGSNSAYLAEGRFEYVRNISRFEGVRLDLINQNFLAALYTIFILEKEFPKSNYLNRMKSQAWLNIASYKKEGKLDQIIPKKSDWEGEISSLYYFIRNMRNKELEIMAMRTIEDCRLKDPENEELNLIWKKMINSLYTSEGFKKEDLKSQTFQQATDSLSLILSENKVDSVVTLPSEELSKYDKIKKKVNTIENGSIDSTKFYLYNLSDLVSNELFNREWELLDQANLRNEKLKDSINDLSNRAYKRYIKNKNEQTDLSKYILVDPSAVSYTKRSVNYEKSEALKIKYNEAFKNASDLLGLELISIDRFNLAAQGTESFNDRGILTSLLIQITNSPKEKMLVDYDIIQNLTKKYGTSKLVFTIVEHLYYPEFSGNIFYSILFPPLFPYFFAAPFIKGNNTEINVLVLDTKKGEITAVGQYFFEEPSTKLVLQAHLYDILKNL
ncbi:MAG: M48 family metalloprotease [Bacteroidetes bacterium]|nr:M48 family metalloprotease [Bacteroidota bacterium]